MNIKPTRSLAAAVNALCESNERTRGAVVGDVLLGAGFVLVTLRRPIVIDGQCTDVRQPLNEVDLLDLIDDFRRTAAGQA